MNINKSVLLNDLEIKLSSSKTHLFRLEGGLGLDSHKIFPKPYDYLQRVFSYLLEKLRSDIDKEFDEEKKLISKKKKLDEIDARQINWRINAQIELITNFYQFYWGSVSFSIHSVPWYFTSFLLEILVKVFKEDGNSKLVIFPDMGQNLGVVALKDEIDKLFGIDLDKVNELKVDTDCPGNYYIFRLPSSLILDPMANFIILHEIGHYFVQKQISFKSRIIIKLNSELKKYFKTNVLKNKAFRIEQKEIDSILQSDGWNVSWLTEILCDIFSVSLGGIAIITAAQEHFLIEEDIPSQTHPPPSLRIEAMKSFLLFCKRKHWLNNINLTNDFGGFFKFKNEQLSLLLSPIFNEMVVNQRKCNLFYIDLLSKYFKKGVVEINNDNLPINLQKEDCLFNYILTLNCIWSLYLMKTDKIGEWRDKFNEIVLKVLEIEQFRKVWEENKEDKIVNHSITRN